MKVGEDRAQATNGKEGSRHEETESGEKECPAFKFELGPTDRIGGVLVGSDPISKKEGPMAMTYEMDSGWVAETLGPTSGHWKRRARVGQAKGKEKMESSVQMKRGTVIPSSVLDQNGLGRKRRKVEKKGGDGDVEENKKDGGEAVAATQHRRAT